MIAIGIQRRFKLLGDEGCYALCVAKAGWPEATDAQLVDLVAHGMALGFVDAAVKVVDPESFMALCAGGRWKVEIAEASYRGRVGEILIEKWSYTNAKSGKYFEHFAWRTADGKLWDPLGDSETLKQGACVGKRVFKRKA